MNTEGSKLYCTVFEYCVAEKYTYLQSNICTTVIPVCCWPVNEKMRVSTRGRLWCPVRSVYSHGHIHPETEWEAWQPNIRHVYLYPPLVLRHWLCIYFSWGLVLSYQSHSLTIFCWYKAESSVIIGWQREKYYECMCAGLFDKFIR